MPTAEGTTRKARARLIAAAITAIGEHGYAATEYEQIKRRHGDNKAIVAVAHSILVAAYYILRDNVAYHELGGDYYAPPLRPRAHGPTSRRPARAPRDKVPLESLPQAA